MSPIWVCPQWLHEPFTEDWGGRSSPVRDLRLPMHSIFIHVLGKMTLGVALWYLASRQDLYRNRRHVKWSALDKGGEFRPAVCWTTDKPRHAFVGLVMCPSGRYRASKSPLHDGGLHMGGSNLEACWTGEELCIITCLLGQS